MKNLQEIQKLYQSFKNKYGYDVQGAQQGSESWFTLKLGVISASNIHHLIPSKRGGYKVGRQTYMHQLVAQVCTGMHKDFASAATDWGHSNEDAARATFEMMNDTKLTELPFIFKDDSFREGASPDAVDEWGSGVEIKCPYATENHIAFAASDIIKPEYQWQLQYTMRVCDTDTWHFCSFDPRMKKNPLAVKLVKRDEDMQSVLDEEVPKFIEEFDVMLKGLGFDWGDQWKDLNNQ